MEDLASETQTYVLSLVIYSSRSSELVAWSRTARSEEQRGTGAWSVEQPADGKAASLVRGAALCMFAALTAPLPPLLRQPIQTRVARSPGAVRGRNEPLLLRYRRRNRRRRSNRHRPSYARSARLAFSWLGKKRNTPCYEMRPVCRENVPCYEKNEEIQVLP